MAKDMDEVIVDGRVWRPTRYQQGMPDDDESQVVIEDDPPVDPFEDDSEPEERRRDPLRK
jgi:hypothetical protein